MVIHKVKINHQIFRKSLIIFCLFLVLYATYTFQNFNKPDVIRLVESEEYQFEFTTYLQTQNSMDLDELNEFFAIHNQVEIKLQYYGDVYSQITNESKYSYVIDNYIDYEITYELNINPDLIDPRIKNELNTTELTNKLRGEIYDLWSDNSSNFDVEVLGSGIYTNQLQYNKNDVSYREILQDDFYLDYISIQILMILIWLVTIPVIYKRVYELFEFLRKNNHIRTGSTPVNQRTKIKWFNIYLRIYFILLIAFIILNVLIKTLSPYNILLSLNFSIIPILHTVIFFAVFYQTKNLNFVKVVSSFFGFIIALLLYLYFIGFHLLIHVFMIYVIYLACFSLGNFIFFGSRNSISDTEDINSLTRSEFNQITKTIYIDENFIRFVTSLVLAISVVSISISISFDIDFNIISGSNYQDLIFYLIYLILVFYIGYQRIKSILSTSYMEKLVSHNKLSQLYKYFTFFNIYQLLIHIFFSYVMIRYYSLFDFVVGNYYSHSSYNYYVYSIILLVNLVYIIGLFLGLKLNLKSDKTRRTMEITTLAT